MRDAYAAYRTKAHDPAAAAKSIDALQELVLQGGPTAPAACVALVKVGGCRLLQHGQVLRTL